MLAKTMTESTSDTKKLKATISIVATDARITWHNYPRADPVLLRGMELPAEASYDYPNPLSGADYPANLPLTIELFFGESGWEGDDVALGKFLLRGSWPQYPGTTGFEVKLAVNGDELLSIAVLDHITARYRSVAFIDISDLEPPQPLAKPGIDGADQTGSWYDQIAMILNPERRETGIPRRGADLSQRVTISFEEALSGTSKDIEVASTETCPACAGRGTPPGTPQAYCADCQGTGWKREEKETDRGPRLHAERCPTCEGDGLIIAEPCSNCEGKTWVRTARRITLQVPSCLDSGSEVCILHQGEPGRYGGPPGHLRIAVDVVDHPLLSRTGRDLSIHLPVSAELARRGGQVRVPGVERGSFFLLDLPAGTQNGAALTLWESETYKFAAIVETYPRAFLFALPNTKKRLQAMRKWLDDADDQLSPHPDAEPERTQTAPERDRGARADGELVHEMAAARQGMRQARDAAEFYARRGSVCVERGDLARARADYDKALKLDPSCASAHDGRGMLYLSQGKPAEALADLNEAVRLDPDNAEYYHHRGMFYHSHKDPARVLADYNRALELDPARADFYESRGKLHAFQQNLGAALADYGTVLELDPGNAKIYHERGLLYRGLQDLPRSLTDLSRALELDPHNPSVLGDRSLVYLLLDDLENALADLNKVIERKPKAAWAYNNRSLVYLRLNNLDKALADCNRALELDPRDASFYSNRGKIHLHQDRYQEAIEDLTRALDLHPKNLETYYLLGRSYQGMGETKQAVTCCNRILRNDPDPVLRRKTQQLLDDLNKQ